MREQAKAVSGKKRSSGETYLLRAKVLAGDDAILLDAELFPQFKLGLFEFRFSPNSDHFHYELLHQRQRIDKETMEDGFGVDGQANQDYPVSAFMVETKLRVDHRAQRFAVADRLLEDLETLLRLFKHGYVCIRRHSLWWHTRVQGWVRDDQCDVGSQDQWGLLKAKEFLSRGKLPGWTPEQLLEWDRSRGLAGQLLELIVARLEGSAEVTARLEAKKQSKLNSFTEEARQHLKEWDHFKKDGAYVHPEPDTPYWEGLFGEAQLENSYTLKTEEIRKLAKFYRNCWHLIQSKPPPLNVALSRFSASYEKTASSDRLIDLITALEALLGKGRADLTYKLALRASCFVYPPGEARKMAFDTIKSFYDWRSRIVHGETTELKDELRQKMNLFEGYIRDCIKGWLKHCIKGIELSTEDQLDGFLFFTKHPGKAPGQRIKP